MTKKLSGILLALGVACASVAATPAVSQADASTRFKVLSYNIHNPTPPAKYHPTSPWENRRVGVVTLVNSEAPDIFTLQETTRGSDGVDPAPWLYTQFPGFGVFPAGYSSNHIFYDSSRFTPLLDGSGKVRAGTRTFVPGSATGKPLCANQDNRKMNWIILTDTRTNRKYFVASTHLHSNPDNTATPDPDDKVDCVDYRATAAHQIHAEINQYNPENYPIVLMGDFNNQSASCSSTSAGRPITILTENADDDHVYNLNATVAPSNCTAANATFNHLWDRSTANDSSTIDWIFRSASLTVTSPSINKFNTSNMGDGTTSSPSDHYALVATLDPAP